MSAAVVAAVVRQPRRQLVIRVGNREAFGLGVVAFVLAFAGWIATGPVR